MSYNYTNIIVYVYTYVFYNFMKGQSTVISWVIFKLNLTLGEKSKKDKI